MTLHDITVKEPYEVIATEQIIQKRLAHTLNIMNKKHSLERKIVGIVPVLTGALFFMRDVALLLPSKCIIEPVRISLYGNKRTIDTERLKNIERYFTLKPSTEVLKQCDIILLVDDIVGTGYTLKILSEYFKQQLGSDKEIISLVLVNITNSPERVYNPDYYLLEGDASNWYFGYGMDYMNGLFRNFPHLLAIKQNQEVK